MTSDDIKNFLREETETTWRFERYLHSKSGFTGEVSSDRFKLSRILINSALNLTSMEGKISPQGHGSSININITLGKGVRVILAVVYGISLFWMFRIAYASLARSAPMDSIFIPICMLIFAYLLSMFGFYVELGHYEMFLHSNLDKNYR